MPRFTVNIEFDNEAEMLTYLTRSGTPERALPDPAPMKATPPARPKAEHKVEPKAEHKVEPKVEPKAEHKVEPKVEVLPTAEQVSAAIIKFLPKPEHKARAAAVLTEFGVQRGKDLTPDQRAPFLAALAKVGAELGI